MTALVMTMVLVAMMMMVDTSSNDYANWDDEYALSYNFPQLHRYTDKARRDFFHPEKELNISIAVVINVLHEMDFG